MLQSLRSPYMRLSKNLDDGTRSLYYDYPKVSVIVVLFRIFASDIFLTLALYIDDMLFKN